jgi:hypothetical protein
MSNATRSLSDHLSEVSRANRSVSLEMASIISFLFGLALAVVSLWPLAFSFMASVVPEDNNFDMERSVLPEFVQLALSKRGIMILCFSILIPAALLMSAGVVIRHFWEKK